jgi:S1-C subfamily serine protease
MSGVGSNTVGRFWFIASGALLAVACIRPEQLAIEGAFARDTGCGTAIATAMGEEGRWRVVGCDQSVEYVCSNVSRNVGSCTQQAPEGDSSASARNLDEDEVRRRREHQTPLSSDIRMETQKGKAVLSLDIRLDRSSFVRLTAVPEERSDLLQIKVVRREEPQADCNLEFLINGQRRQVPKSTTSRDGYVVSQRVHLNAAVINDLAVAEKISFRACEQRWALNRQQVSQVHDFLERMEDERAWKDKPAERSTGLVSPSGGWPEWKTADTPAPPLGTQTTALEATALFKQLSVSVFQVEASRASGTAQGSAVATSQTELLTNCHVLQDARKIVIKQGTSEWPVRISRAEPASDRCVLAVTTTQLTPIASVRPYHALEVGEAVYTLGSPVGLELTLGSGIISGRREEDGRPYIQMTAPISPGSSGGGLFDARGNLIGITTMVLVGRERVNQALNFAIPADVFWQK